MHGPVVASLTTFPVAGSSSGVAVSNPPPPPFYLLSSLGFVTLQFDGTLVNTRYLMFKIFVHTVQKLGASCDWSFQE